MTRDISQATTYKDKVRPSSAVSRWSMDSSDVDSGVIKDSWGGNDGTINGASTGVSGVGGSEAFSFDGGNDFVDVPTSLDLGSDSFSISMWINKSTDVIDRGSVAWDEVPLWLQRNNGSASLILYFDEVSNGKIGLQLRDSNNNSIGNDKSNTSLNDGNWHHLTISRKSSGLLKFYIDGSISFSYDSSGDVGTINNIILSSIVNGAGDHNRNYRGKIDELRLYTEALSQQQVWKLYNIGRNANWGYSRS